MFKIIETIDYNSLTSLKVNDICYLRRSYITGNYSYHVAIVLRITPVFIEVLTSYNSLIDPVSTRFKTCFNKGTGIEKGFFDAICPNKLITVKKYEEITNRLT